MLDENLKRLIQREIADIHALLDRAEHLLTSAELEEHSFERIAALSQTLTSYYTGVERIFERVVGNLDGSVPEGQRWHSELLRQVSESTSKRAAVISEESRLRLRDYLAFRHRSRHAYAHHLEWEPMSNLVRQLLETWNLVRTDLQRFLDKDGIESK